MRRCSASKSSPSLEAVFTSLDVFRVVNGSTRAGAAFAG